MVAEISPFKYEIAINGKRALLVTVTTEFHSRGSFSLQVVKLGDTPITLKEEYGGFTQDWPVFIEVNLQNEKDQLQDLDNKISTAKYSIDEITKSINNDKCRLINQNRISEKLLVTAKELCSPQSQNITTDLPPVITGPFDDIKALEILYGPYCPEAKVAIWNNMQVPREIDSSEVFPGKQGMVSIIISKEFTQSGTIKRVLITSTNPDDGSNECHACSPLINVALFTKLGEKWRRGGTLSILGLYGSIWQTSTNILGSDRFK